MKKYSRLANKQCFAFSLTLGAVLALTACGGASDSSTCASCGPVVVSSNLLVSRTV